MIRKTKAGRREVWVYNPAIGKKVYIGTFEKLGTVKEDRTAKHAERQAELKFASTHRGRQIPSIDQWATTWLTEYPRPEATTNKHNLDNLKAFRKTHGQRPLDSFSKEEAYQLVQVRPHAAKTVSAMYNDAIRFLNGFDGPNPFHLLTADTKGRNDIDPLTEAEVLRLGELAVLEWGEPFGQCFQAMILFAAWTGCRPGELAALRWTDLKFKEGNLHVERQRRSLDGIQRTKTKRKREIVMPAAAAAAVKAMPVKDVEWVFATPRGAPFGKGSWGYYWRPVRRAFELEQPDSHWLPRRLELNPKDHLDFYELRHFCGSLLADRGASAREIAEQLGNSPEVCERVYVHPYRERIRERNRLLFEQPAPVSEIKPESRKSSGGHAA